MALDDLYQEIILDHYKKPRHPGRLDDAQVEVRHYNPVCGDELTVGLRVDGGRISGIAVDALGCSISQASASVMSEQVLGRSLPDALDVAEAFRAMMHSEGDPDEDVLGDGVAFQGVARYPVRVKCALLGWMALKDAAARAEEGRPGGETEHHTDPADAADVAAMARGHREVRQRRRAAWTEERKGAERLRATREGSASKAALPSDRFNYGGTTTGGD